MTTPKAVSTKIWRFAGLFAAVAILLGFATALSQNGRVGDCCGVASIACLCLALAGLIAKVVEPDRSNNA